MAHYSAVQRHKQRFQRKILSFKVNLIFALLCYVYSHSDSAHNAAVQIVQRGFICGKQHCAVARFNRFFGNAGLSCPHYLHFGFYAGRVVMLHIPYIGVSSSLHLFFCLVYGAAKTVVYFFVYSGLAFEPHKIRRIVYSRVKKLTVFPIILACLIIKLPSQKTESYLTFGHGKTPYIVYVFKVFFQITDVRFIGKQNKFRIFPLVPCQRGKSFLSAGGADISKNNVRTRSNRFIRRISLNKVM